jgi:CheY-like chemotaxis protein
VTNERPLKILLAEDNTGDIFLVRRALLRSQVECDLITVEDGEAAMRFLDNSEVQQDRPDLILLDLNLPRRSGHQILHRLKNSPYCQNIPVIILTSSDSPGDRAQAQRLGAAYYFCKPTDLSGFMKLGNVVKDVMSRDRVREDS